MIKQEILDKLDDLENYLDELEEMLESDKGNIKIEIQKTEDEIEILTDMLDEMI